MKLSEYQKQAISSIQYHPSVALPYILLGIAGEVAELYEKHLEYKKQKSHENFSLLIKEKGDVMWYLSAWADYIGKDITDFLTTRRDGISIEVTYQEMILSAGAICEFGKKGLRDDFELIQQGKFCPQKTAKINEQIAFLLNAIKTLCEDYGQTSFEYVLDKNIEKLNSRVQRNAIQGSGDNR